MHQQHTREDNMRWFAPSVLFALSLTLVGCLAYAMTHPMAEILPFTEEGTGVSIILTMALFFVLWSFLLAVSAVTVLIRTKHQEHTREDSVRWFMEPALSTLYFTLAGILALVLTNLVPETSFFIEFSAVFAVHLSLIVFWIFCLPS